MSTLYAKKTKISVGKWGYRGFVIEKDSNKAWNCIEGDVNLLKQVNSDKTVKAICIQIDKLLGFQITDKDNEKTKEVRKEVKKSDHIKTDIKNILSSNFAKTRKTKYVYDESGKPKQLTFEVMALDGMIRYKPLQLTFDSDIVKSKRLELVSLIEKITDITFLDRIKKCKEFLTEISKEKFKLDKMFKGLELMRKRSKLDELHWISLTFDVIYTDNSNFSFTVKGVD